ncbi:oxidoreductase [Sulfuriferula multivorans]|uniref:Protein tas n=1 Tax=Sulfuriferula multivorans TaxID=1559896 RepID=A0A401JYY9_9PROT|nr:aldo/keto reductase [Sulfuriferula multivorans]GCB02253.1 oxidoreductase [Sulfuriferula multivorans]
MNYRQLGNSDLKVSEITLGTMTFGEQNSPEEAARQLDYAIAHGVNFIDVAEMYPVPPRAETQGRTEDYVGRWLSKQSRDKLIIATKITGPGRGFEWVRGGPRITPKQIRAATDASLTRLKTDYIDLYQIHWPDRNVPTFGQSEYDPGTERETTPIVEQLGAFADLIQAGKIRHVGLSNETPCGVCQFTHAAEEARLPRVVSIQNAYNLLNRTFEFGLAETCHREQLGLLAYSPLGFGTLTGKYIGGADAGRMTRFPGFGQRYNKPMVPEAVAAYVELARQVHMHPTTLALAFVRSRWFVTSTIIGATTMEQLQQNLDSVEVAMDAGLLEKIQAIHTRYPNPAP